MSSSNGGPCQVMGYQEYREPCHGSTERGYAGAPSNYVEQPNLRLDPRFRALITKPKAYTTREYAGGVAPPQAMQGRQRLTAAGTTADGKDAADWLRGNSEKLLRVQVMPGGPTSFAPGGAGADAIVGSKFMRGRELRQTKKVVNHTRLAASSIHHLGAGTHRGYDLYYQPDSHQKRTPEIIREIDHTLSFNRRRNPLWGNHSVAPIPSCALRPDQFSNGCECAGACAHKTQSAHHEPMGAKYEQSQYKPFFDRDNKFC